MTAISRRRPALVTATGIDSFERGAVSNLQGRYEILAREGIDDGRQYDVNENDASSSWETQVFEEDATDILSRNASRDIPFNVSPNPCRDCEQDMSTWGIRSDRKL